MVQRSSRSSTFCVVITTGLLVLSVLMMLMAIVVGCSGTTNTPSLVVTSFSAGEGAADAPMHLRFDRPAVGPGPTHTGSMIEVPYIGYRDARGEHCR